MKTSYENYEEKKENVDLIEILNFNKLKTILEIYSEKEKRILECRGQGISGIIYSGNSKIIITIHGLRIRRVDERIFGGCRAGERGRCAKIFG